MLSLLLLTPLLRLASAQLYEGVAGINALESGFNGSHFCNKSFADANATRSLSFNPNYGTTNTTVSYFGSVYQPANGTGGYTELSLWFSPGDRNFTNDFTLGYDVCYLWPQHPTLNTFYRGIQDNGSCTTMFDEVCVNDLNSLSASFAEELVGSPSTSPSNLTADSLPTVCTDLASMLTQNFPDSCKVYFNSTAQIQVAGGLPAFGGPLTGPESLVSNSECISSNGYSLLWTQYGENTYENYIIARYYSPAILTTFMPIANSARPGTIPFSKSFMTCGCINNATQGSEALPNPPQPTPVINPYADGTNTSSNATAGSNTTAVHPDNGNASTGLSSGAIAGVAVGVILGVALLVGLISFFIFKRRSSKGMAKRKQGEGVGEMQGYGRIESKQPQVEAPAQNYVSEIGAQGERMELPAWEDAEMHELSAQERWRRSQQMQPAELPGEKF